MSKLLSPAKVYALAVAFFAKEEEAGTVLPLSPAKATTTLASRKDTAPKSRLIPVVAEAYYAENGRRFPLPKSAAKGRKSLAAAIVVRREKGGRLGRWDVIAYSASETLGRPVAVAAVKALYRETRGDEGYARSYTGRGTREGAPLTRGDEVAEVEGSLG